MAKSILQIVIQTLKDGNADKETIYALKSIQSSIGNVTAVAGAMAGAYMAVDQVIGESVRSTVAYANEVRNMMQLTGQSAEEASRTIQVMDDLKVETDVLTMATKTLSKEGLTLNIETLARLSDEYNTLGSGAEKTRFLVEKFGKSGLGMAEAMQQGGDALREMSSAVEGSLVLNERAIENARQFEREQDNLNDTMMAYKVALGNYVIPALLNLISITQQTQNATQALNDAHKSGSVIMANSAEAAIRLRAAHEQQESQADSATLSYIAMGKALKENVVTNLDAATEATKELTKANQLILSTVSSMQSAEKSYADDVKRLADERAQIERDKAAEIAKGWETSQEKLADYDRALDANSQKARENAAQHDLASKQIVLGLIQQKMTADGILTDDEMNWLLQKGESWGIYSKTVVTEAQKAIAEANMINDAINNITDSKTIQIYLKTNYSGGDLGDHVSDNRERDSGGPGKAGQAYIINPSAGPEAFIPSTDGYFVPNIDRLGGGSSTVVVNFYHQPAISLSARADAKEAATPIVEEIVRRMR